MALHQVIFLILFSTAARGEYLNDTDYYYSMESINNNETSDAPIMDLNQSKVTHVDSKTLSGSIELTTLQVLTTIQPLEEVEEETDIDLKQSETTTLEPLPTTQSQTDTITIKSKQNFTDENIENLLEPGLLSSLDETTKVPTDGIESSSSSGNPNNTELMDDVVNGTSGATYTSASSTTEKLIIVTPIQSEFDTPDETTTEKIELVFSENEYENTTPYFNSEDVRDFDKVFAASVESDEFNEMVKTEVTVAAAEIPATAVSDFKNDLYLQEFSKEENVIESTTDIEMSVSSTTEFLDKTPNGTDDEIETENSFFMFSTTTSINQEDGVDEDKIKTQTLTDEPDNFTTTTENVAEDDEETATADAERNVEDLSVTEGIAGAEEATNAAAESVTKESSITEQTLATFSTTEENTKEIITSSSASLPGGAFTASEDEEVTTKNIESTISIEIKTESSLSTTKENKEFLNTEEVISNNIEGVSSVTEVALKAEEMTESVTENVNAEKAESTSLPPGFTTTEISTTINDESHEFQKTAINRTNEGNKFDFYATDKPTTDITSIQDGDKAASSTFQENNNKEESLSTINIQISEITSTPALPINNNNDNKNEFNDEESLPISTEKIISVTRASDVIQSTISIDETTSRPFLIEITKSMGIDDNNKNPTSVPATQEITSTVIPFLNEDITNTPDISSTSSVFVTQTVGEENFISNSNSTSFENENEDSMTSTSQTIALTTPSSTFALEILTKSNAFASTTLPTFDSDTLPITENRNSDKRNDAIRGEKVFEIITANPEEDKEPVDEVVTNSHFFNEQDNAIKEPKTTTEDPNANEKWVTEASQVTSEPFNSFGDIVTEINVVEIINGEKVVTKYNQRENVKDFEHDETTSGSATSLPVVLSLIKENLASDDSDPNNNIEDVISFMKLELSKDENNKTVKSEVDETIESSSVLLNKWNDSVREELVAVVLEEEEEKIDKGGEVIQEALGDQTSPLYGLTLTSPSTPSAVEVKSNGEFPRTSTEIAHKEQIIVNEIEQEEEQIQALVENETKKTENDFPSAAPISFLEETSSITSTVASQLVTVVEEEEGRKINEEENGKNLVNLLVDVIESVIEQTSEETTTKDPEEITYFVEKVAEEVNLENETILQETATIAIDDNKDEHEIIADNSLEPSTVKNVRAEESTDSTFDETSKDNEIKESNTPASSENNKISLVESFAKNSSDVDGNKIEFFTQVDQDKVSTTTLDSLLSTSSHSYENESNSTIAIVNETAEINDIIEKEPEIYGKVNARNVSFTAKITHKDSQFFVPSDAFLSTNVQNLLNITWRSSNEHLNNSLSFDFRYFPEFTQLNLVNGDEMHAHRTTFMSESHKINPLIVFNDELQVQFSSFDFLQGLDKPTKTPDALPSSNQTRSLTAEIMGACIGFSVIIGILLYYSIKAYKGKTREFKPNSTSP